MPFDEVEHGGDQPSRRERRIHADRVGVGQLTKEVSVTQGAMRDQRLRVPVARGGHAQGFEDPLFEKLFILLSAGLLDDHT